MNLNLKRLPPSLLATLGEMSIDSVFECYTLERPDVQIPLGEYTIEMTYSPRFKRLLPLLEEVPDRTNIRIHAGNWPRDTEGCILVGLQRGVDSIFQSQMALDPLIVQIQSALDRGEKVTITVI